MEVIKSGINFKIIEKHEGVSFESDIFPSHFLLVICAKPGAGKTTLIKFILRSSKFFFKKYDFIYIVSPSGKEEYKDMFFPQDNFSSRFDINWINEKIDHINSCYSNEYINALFILDDVVGALNKDRYSDDLMSFVFNRRHLIKNGMISIILTSQKFNVVPTSFRAVMTVLILFNAIKREIETIKESIIYNKVDFDKIIDFVFDNTEGNFLIYNIAKGLYFKKFDQILIS
jgi:hypothetical protein